MAVIEASANLLDWIPIWTNPRGVGPAFFSDPQTNAHHYRFYHALTS